jgi:two-component system, NtrC family, C4-dicarboxylate transport sensor histidine kinase DctB
LNQQRFIPFFFIGLLFIFLGFSLFFYVNLDKYRLSKTEDNIHSTLLSYQSFHRFNAEFQRPIVESFINKGQLPKSFFAPELLSSSYGANEIFSKYRTLREELGMLDVEFKISSGNPTNPKNLGNAYELAILEDFNLGGITEHSKIIERNGEKFLHYAIPFRASDPSCLECHGDPKDAPLGMIELYGDKNGFWENAGEIRAMISIYSPIESLFANSSFYFVILAAVFAMLAVIFVIVVIVKKKLEQKDSALLQHAQNAAMGEMVSMLSHQWHHPLLKLEKTSHKIEKVTANKELSKELNEQIQFLQDTMKNFRLFFSEHGHSEAEVNLDLVVEEAIRLFENIFQDLEVKVNLETRTEQTTFIYKNELVQVLVNIFNNAKDAFVESSEKHRKIHIKISKEERLLRIGICDNAGRCEDETISKIFEANLNDESAPTKRGHLYLASTIVKDQLEGKLFATNFEQGVCFEIYLPINTEPTEEDVE